MAFKLAFEATVITMIFLGILVLLINRIKPRNTCPICGDSCRGKFCCEAHELLHFSEEEFSREEVIGEDEEDIEATMREEKKVGNRLD